MLVTIYNLKWHNSPEDLNHHKCQWENLKSHIMALVLQLVLLKRLLITRQDTHKPIKNISLKEKSKCIETTVAGKF
jgi:hypothetical protein